MPGWTSARRPKLPVEIRPGNDCNGLVTRRRRGNLPERQLFDRLSGSNQLLPQGLTSVGGKARDLVSACLVPVLVVGSDNLTVVSVGESVVSPYSQPL